MMTSVAAKLIARLWQADRWTPREDLSSDPVLGPIVTRRSARYEELRHSTNFDFTTARLVADEEAIQSILSGIGAYAQADGPLVRIIRNRIDNANLEECSIPNCDVRLLLLEIDRLRNLNDIEEPM